MLREMRVVDAPENSSDFARGPFEVSSAAVVLDLVLQGWYDERDDHHAMVTNAGAHDEYVMLHALRRTLLSHACNIVSAEARLKGRAAWRMIGISTVRGDGETHYHCLFCEENLATLGHGTISVIAKPLMRRITNHTTVCAMRFLMESK